MLLNLSENLQTFSETSFYIYGGFNGTHGIMRGPYTVQYICILYDTVDFTACWYY